MKNRKKQVRLYPSQQQRLHWAQRKWSPRRQRSFVGGHGLLHRRPDKQKSTRPTHFVFDVCSIVSVPAWTRILIVLCSDAAYVIESINLKQHIEDNVVFDGWSMKMIVTRQRARTKGFSYFVLFFSRPVYWSRSFLLYIFPISLDIQVHYWFAVIDNMDSI